MQKKRLTVKSICDKPLRHLFFNKFGLELVGDVCVVTVWFEGGANVFSFMLEKYDWQVQRDIIEKYLANFTEDIARLDYRTCGFETRIPAVGNVDNFRQIKCSRTEAIAECYLTYFPVAKFEKGGEIEVLAEVALSSSIDTHLAMLSKMIEVFK